MRIILPGICYSRSKALSSLTIATIGLTVAAQSFASGWPPFVADDSATVSRGGSTSVLDSGNSSVLTNDFDFERDPLQAYLAKVPKHGQVVLNLDGSFTYTHNGDDKDKDDDFEYVAWDGTRASRKAKVKISVEYTAPVAPTITGQKPVSISEDTSLPVVLAFLEVDDPDNRFPDDFTLEVADGANYSRSGTEITPAPNYFGQLRIPVRVNDGTNNSQWFDLEVDVVAVNDPPFVTGTPGDQEAIESFAFSLETAGYFDDIDSGDRLRFSANGLPASRNLTVDPVTGVLSGTPQAADVSATPYSVSIIARDQGGLTARVTFLLTVFPDDRVDLSVTVSLVANPISPVEDAQWNIDIENLGPADLDDPAELNGNWTTGGANLTLSAPPGCTVDNNDGIKPELRCPVPAIAAGSTLSIPVQGSFDTDGDNTVFAVVIADDFMLANNTAVTSGNVIAEFSEGPTQILENGGSDIAAADFNGDGALDIVTIGSETLVYFNGNNRSFEPVALTLGTESAGSHVVALDWNGDGWMDLATSHQGNEAAAIWLNDGSGNFAPPLVITETGVGLIADMAAADVDQNGAHELGATGAGGTALVRSSGTDDMSVTTLSSQPGIAMAVGDLDQDAFPDVAVVSAGDRTVMIYTNNGDGQTFAAMTEDFGSVARISIADVDQDGGGDLLLSTDGADLVAPHITFASMQADGRFAAGDSIGASRLEALLGGDVNGDANMDLVAINSTGIHQAYHRQQANDYDLNAEQIVSASMQQGVLADFNADGSLDLVLTGQSAGVTEFHANNGVGRLGLGDRTAPQLTIMGEQQISVAAGSAYLDEGALAEDDIEGDISGRIQTSGSVNTASPGVYSITYSVADRAGNTASASRVVKVEVNAGTGGSGGGTLSPIFVLLFMFLVVMVRHQNREIART